jgi:hypothetical protein
LRAGTRRRNRAHGFLVLERLERDVLAIEQRLHVGDYDRVAQIRLVDAVAEHRFGIRDAGERRGRNLAAGGELLEHAMEHGFDRCENILLRDEAHLEVELIELAGAAVRPARFVTEAWRDLEIAVEARDHDELLELLRRLGKRVELPRMQPRRHEEVARAFGRGRGQDRRLKLEEALRHHAPADRLDHLRPQHDVLVEALARQIEERYRRRVSSGYSRSPKTGPAARPPGSGSRPPRSGLQPRPSGRLGFTVSADRATTGPVRVNTHSERAWESLEGRRSGSTTHWVRP